MDKFIGQPLSRKDIRKAAKMMRLMCNMEQGRLDIIRLIEYSLPRLDHKFQWEIRTIEEMTPGVYAFFDPITDTLVIREDVYERAYAGNGRDRFTLAHEVGHYLFHSDQAMLQRVESGMETPIYRSPEWQANTFASKILMPYDEIVGKTPEQIMKEYGVSFSAAEIAAKNAQNAKKTDLF